MGVRLIDVQPHICDQTPQVAMYSNACGVATCTDRIVDKGNLVRKMAQLEPLLEPGSLALHLAEYDFVFGQTATRIRESLPRNLHAQHRSIKLCSGV